MARAILRWIAKHPEPDKCGPILIDREDTNGTTFLSSLSSEEARCNMPKRDSESALYELTSLGWLVTVGESPKFKCYRLSALARANCDFLALVDEHWTEMEKLL